MPSFYAINDVNEVDVCTGRLQAGPNGIRGIVFSAEEYNASDFAFLMLKRPQSTGRYNRRHTSCNLGLSQAGVTGNNGDLAPCDAARPQPAYRLGFNIR